MSENDTIPILIAGPTASGKSALALALAQKLNGRIINADSMQVYGVLRELTARPSEDEEAQAKHRLYGHISPRDPYSVGEWEAEAIAEIAAAQMAGEVPIIIGGTGLYFKSLTEGLVDIPDIPDDIRSHWRDRQAQEGSAALHAALGEVDADLAARLEPNDKQRILRGLEVFSATDRPLSAWHAVKPVAPLAHAHKILLMPDREWLYARCNLRFEHMMAGAAIDEVQALAALDLPPDVSAMKALGVSDVLAYIRGTIDKQTAISQAQQATRRYAKRQMTWFRNQMIDWPSFTEQEYTQEMGKIFSVISKNTLTEK